MTSSGRVRVVTAAVTTRVAQRRAALSPKTLVLCILLITTQTQATEDTITNCTVTTLYPVTNKTENETNTPTKETKKSYTAWTIDTAYTASNLTKEKDSNSTDSKEEREEKNVTKEFRPSQHLGSFFDEETAEVIKKPVFGPVKKPASGFVSSPKDEYFSIYKKKPKQVYQTFTEFPYKFENAIYTKAKGNWHFDDSIESKPTVEIPVKVPAGGLYKSPDVFKGKPVSGEEYALDVNDDGKEHAVKKRGNPWQHLLRVMTAFIPVGLIISALTPSVITIQETGPQYPANQFRRSDPELAEIAPISERCRRRLLCELHSDRHYTTSSAASRRKKHCYKIHCEDTEALWRMLQWVLTYHQPEANDHRARHVT